MPICSRWHHVVNMSNDSKLGASKGIVIINIIIRFFIIWVSKFFGSKTETDLAF